MAMSWSMARIVSTCTPLRLHDRLEMSISPWVWDSSGDFLSVQLMNSALRSEKSQRALGRQLVHSVGHRHSHLLGGDATRPLMPMPQATPSRRAAAVPLSNPTATVASTDPVALEYDHACTRPSGARASAQPASLHSRDPSHTAPSSAP